MFQQVARELPPDVTHYFGLSLASLVDSCRAVIRSSNTLGKDGAAPVEIVFPFVLSPTHPIKIVSGGQTGADRGALDAALAAGVLCGGWCPHDRMAEDGPIDPKYPVTPLPGAGYRERTRKNVQDSDATVLFSFGPPDGGTLVTLDDCQAFRKPHLLIDAATHTPDQAAASILAFIRREQIHTLNIAGPRASREPRIYEYVLEVTAKVLAVVQNVPI